MSDASTQFYVYALLAPPSIGVQLVAEPVAERALAEALASGPGPERLVIEAGTAKEAGEKALAAFGLQAPPAASESTPAPR